MPHLTASFKVENNSDLTGKIIIVLEHANKTTKKEGTDMPAGEPENGLDFRNSGQKESQHFSQNNHLFQKEFHRANSDIIHVLAGRKQKQRINSKEDLLNLLLHRKSSASADGMLENPSKESETSLDGILPGIQQTNETHWKHQKEGSEPSSVPSNSPPQDNYSIQGDQFEAELNKRLQPLIPNIAVRKLLCHVIRTLKMDCTEPTVQLACAKLISKTGLLMKLFSEREDVKGASSLWNSYLWEEKNTANGSANQKRAGKKVPEEISSPELPEYGYGNKLLLAISVTVVIMIIIAVICLIEICSQRSAASAQAANENKLQGTGSSQKHSNGPSKSSSECTYQVLSSSSSSTIEKPLWLRDMYQPLDSIRKKNMAQKLHDKESSDEEEIFNRANIR
uniref:LRRC37A/B like protein 1 C-terminal domain-containing protein n=1 Tax=Sphenodon punctatus TaxID=8508 RepID=A0A8D0GV54_SPHPU